MLLADFMVGAVTPTQHFMKSAIKLELSMLLCGTFTFPLCFVSSNC